jgi:hypothetical protein
MHILDCRQFLQNFWYRLLVTLSGMSLTRKTIRWQNDRIDLCLTQFHPSAVTHRDAGHGN